MGKPVALKFHMHVCPKVDPGPKPHIGGPILKTSQSFVKVNGISIATEKDQALCAGMPGMAKITKGSGLAKIDGKKIARSGDACQHGGKIVQGVSWIKFD